MERKTIKDKAINIVLSKPEKDGGQRFIEIEDDNGYSIKIGEWIKGENFDRIRITIGDIYHQKR